jgi:hypothetical protein
MKTKLNVSWVEDAPVPVAVKTEEQYRNEQFVGVVLDIVRNKKARFALEFLAATAIVVTLIIGLC